MLHEGASCEGKGIGTVDGESHLGRVVSDIPSTGRSDELLANDVGQVGSRIHLAVLEGEPVGRGAYIEINPIVRDRDRGDGVGEADVVDAPAV